MSDCRCTSGNICPTHGVGMIHGGIASGYLGNPIPEQDSRPDLVDEVIKLSKRVHVLEREVADYKRLELNTALRLNEMDKTVDEIKDVLLKMAENGRHRGNR